MKRRLVDALIENDQRPTPLAPMELASLLGVPPERVHEAQSRLRSRRQVRPSERQSSRTAKPKSRASVRRAEPATSPTLGRVHEPERDAPLDLEKLLARVENEPIADADARRRILSVIARTGPAPVRVAAINALENLDRQRGEQVQAPAAFEQAGAREVEARLNTLPLRVALLRAPEVCCLLGTGHADIKARWPAWKPN